MHFAQQALTALYCFVLHCTVLCCAVLTSTVLCVIDHSAVAHRHVLIIRAYTAGLRIIPSCPVWATYICPECMYSTNR